MQQITPSTAETVLTHAEKWPMSFVAVLLIAALAYWLLFKFWPAWLLEQEKHREHLAKALAQRGVEAQQDLAAQAKLHESQQTHMVRELGGRLDKTHERVSDVHKVVQQIAQKVGVGILALGLFSGAFVAGFGVAQKATMQLRHAEEDAERIKCDPPCSVGFVCRRGVCKEVKEETASGPLSTLRYAALTNYAAPSCWDRAEDCHAK